MTDSVYWHRWRRLLNTRLRDLLRGRVDARLDWRQIVDAACLPEPISGAIICTVRCTRLWRSEKVDVARELVSHFQEGLATNRSPKQLVGAFGNVRLAAKLIRRAKKRQRPIGWHFARWCGWGVAAGIALYLAAGVYLLFGRPQISVDYLARVNRRALRVPESARAWPLYRKALLDLQGEISRPDREASPLVALQNVRPEGGAWPQAQSLLVQHAAAMDLLRQAGRQESLGFPVWPTVSAFSVDDQVLIRNAVPGAPLPIERPYPDRENHLLISTLLPQIGLLREAAGVLSTDFHHAVRGGKAEIALSDIIAQLGVSRHMQESAFLSSSLAAAEVQMAALRQVQFVLISYPELWSNDQLRTLAHQIERNEIDWQRGLEGDRAYFYDIVQRLYTDDGHGDGHVAPDALKTLSNITRLDRSPPSTAPWFVSGMANFLLLPAVNVIAASRREMTDAFDRYLDQMGRSLSEPYWESHERNQDRALAALRNGWFESGLRYRYALIAFFAPDDDLPAMVERHRGFKDGILIGMALEHFRREQGNWPQALAELSPRWLPAVPVDRISGQPLRYRVVEGKPVVYSIGLDQDDDGGRAPAGADAGPGGRLFGRPYSKSHQPQEDPRYDGDWLIWPPSSQDGPESESSDLNRDITGETARR